MITEPDKPKNYIPYPKVNYDNLAQNYAEGPRIKVRCIDPQGIYYDFNRRREGDTFILHPMKITMLDKRGKPVKKDGEIQYRVVTAKEQFSEATMEIVEEDEPVRISTAQEAVNKKQADLDALKASTKA